MIELDSLCGEFGMVGAVVGASVRGERSVATHGIANQATGLPVTRDTCMSAGSITKAMTASLVALLVDDGAVALDAPVVDIVPGFRVADPVASAAITVRHLLTHTAGFDGDVWPDLGEGDDAMARLVAFVADAAQLSPPGAAFSYNNAAYAVLGRAIELVTGDPFEAVLRERLGGPCGASFTTDVRRVLARPFAVGHGRSADGTVEVIDGVIGPACLAAAGSRTWATIDDLLAFGELHLGRHGEAATHQALVAMRAPQLRVHDPNNGGTMALGVFLDDRWGTPVVFHDGGVLGQSAYLRILPETDTVLAVMGTGGVPQVFHRHVFARLAAQLGLVAPHGAVVDPHCAVEPSRYVGRYEAASTRVDVEDAGGAMTVDITWGHSTPTPVTTGRVAIRPVDPCVFLAPIDGRDYVIVFPPLDEPCDHLLAGLRRLNRASSR